jgi:hypothetical protein
VLTEGVVEVEIVGEDGGSGAKGMYGIESDPGECGDKGDVCPCGLSRFQERRTRGPAVTLSIDTISWNEKS